MAVRSAASLRVRPRHAEHAHRVAEPDLDPWDDTHHHERQGTARRILYVNPAAQRGGGEVVIRNLAQGMRRYGYQVEVVLLARGPLAAEFRALGIRTSVLPAGRFRQKRLLLRTLWHLARLMRRRDIALVQSAGAKGHIYGGLAAALAGVPATWRLQDYPSLTHPWAYLALRVPADGVVANAQRTLERYARLSRLPRLVDVIYPGVDLGVFPSGTPPEPASQSLREELGLPADAPLVTILGRLQRWKGQHIFLEAAEAVSRRCPEARFLVVGDELLGLEPEYPPLLRRLADKGELAGRVTFTGQRDDVRRVLAASDVLVHASILPEPFGQVIVEAMAQGKAVIASAAGGPLEIIDHGLNGLLTPLGDAAALGEAIVSLLDDQEERASLGVAARLTVEHRFTVPMMVERFARFYDAVLRSRGEATAERARPTIVRHGLTINGHGRNGP